MIIIIIIIWKGPLESENLVRGRRDYILTYGKKGVWEKKVWTTGL